MYRESESNKLMENITESPSHFPHLDRMSVNELLTGINQEDANIYLAIKLVVHK